MVEKIRFGGEWSPKKILAAFLFGAIIVVFALWGLKPANMGGDAGAVAAVVNDRTISLAEFRQSAERVEQNTRSRFDGLPEAQRRQMTAELRRRILEQLIVGEAVYQAAHRKGVIASDAEVKDQILQIPGLQENGRFLGDRYRMWLQSMNLSAEEFERQIRKDLVNQKVQELFIGSAAPTREELRRNRALADQKVRIKFVQLTRDEMKKLGAISDQEVSAYIPAHKKEIEAYYKDNKIDFTSPDKYRARDILIRIDQKRPEAEALKMATDLRKQLTAKNFAAMAKQHSEDPGSKGKGGDLGERSKGSLMAPFESAVLALKPGEISQPVKVEDGYHLVLLESKTPGGTAPLESVEKEVARRMIALTKEGEIANKVRATVEKGDRKEVEALIAKAGLKWQDSGEFDLSASVIPRLGESKEVITGVLKQGRAGGLLHSLVPYQGGFLIVDVADWKEVPDKNPEVEGVDRMMAFRKAEGPLDAWAQEVSTDASIQRNTTLFR